MLKYSESRLEGKEQKKDINNRKFQICGSAFGTGMSVFSMPTISGIDIFERDNTLASNEISRSACSHAEYFPSTRVARWVC